MTRALRSAVLVATVLLGFAAAATSGELPAERPQSQKPQTGAPQPGITLPPALARVLADYEAAWSARDAAALSRLFAEDGFVLPNGRPPVRGRAAIEKAYSGSGGPLALRAFAFAMDGAVGYILGGYAPRKGGSDTGKFTLTLRKGADGRWLIVSDMDSPNRRPLTTPGAATHHPHSEPPRGAPEGAP